MWARFGLLESNMILALRRMSRAVSGGYVVTLLTSCCPVQEEIFEPVTHKVVTGYPGRSMVDPVISWAIADALLCKVAMGRNLWQELRHISSWNYEMLEAAVRRQHSERRR